MQRKLNAGGSAEKYELPKLDDTLEIKCRSVMLERLLKK